MDFPYTVPLIAGDVNDEESGNTEHQVVNFAPIYAALSKDLRPLYKLDKAVEDLAPTTLLGGDIGLHTPIGEEAVFDVIAIVTSCRLRAPPGYPMFALPHLRRWIRVSGDSEVNFSRAIQASFRLYESMSNLVGEGSISPALLMEGMDSFCPSATMLSSFEDMPTAIHVEIPPLDNHAPLLQAIREGQGQFLFSSDNEVLVFSDDVTPNGQIIRHEIRPTSIEPGQLVRVSMSLRLMKQFDGTFMAREHLKAIHLLREGFMTG